MNLIGVPLNSVATKIYQASVHGFSASQFHSKVDGKLGTLSIIKSTNGNIFGGFTKLNWGLSEGGAFYKDPSAYIFSLINTQNFSLIINPISTNSLTIYSGISKGPYFGACDFQIYDMSNSNNLSYSNLGTSFVAPFNYTVNSVAANSFLAGTQYFQTVEVEVYTSNNKYLLTFSRLRYLKKTRKYYSKRTYKTIKKKMKF